jgi:hypothetical protein
LKIQVIDKSIKLAFIRHPTMPSHSTKQLVLSITSEDLQEAPRAQPRRPRPLINNGHPIGPVWQPPVLVRRRIHRDLAEIRHPEVARRLAFD